ncbi:hypothetical protein GALL_50960 [mine drainage metagenome]|uniref:Uncharacterized protein n=1 Tax=mine drainage metagenome TaxID=410659 RepID=A0A1J5SZL6_9ZZZZ
MDMTFKSNQGKHFSDDESFYAELGALALASLLLVVALG